MAIGAGMFSSLISWLKEQFTLITAFWKDFFGSFFTNLANYGTAAWALGTTVIGFVLWCFQSVAASVTEAVQSLATITSPTLNPQAPGSLGYWFSLANTFFPLAEAMAFLVGFLLLVVVLTTYRLVKSWIPTLS